jgi:hypothetical protein
MNITYILSADYLLVQLNKLSIELLLYEYKLQGFQL